MTSKKLLKLGDNELEKISGGCYIDIDSQGIVKSMRISSKEYAALKDGKCFTFNKLRMHSLGKIKQCLKERGFRVVVKTRIIPQNPSRGSENYMPNTLSSLAINYKICD